MKNTIRQVLHSPKFMIGFIMMVVIIISVILYPLFNPGNPLEAIGQGSFLPPGTYFSVFDANNAKTYTIDLKDTATANRAESIITMDDRVNMILWLTNKGVDTQGVTTSNEDIDQLIGLWQENFTTEGKVEGFTTNAKRRDLRNIDARVQSLANLGDMTVTTAEGDTKVKGTDYTRIGDVANVVNLRLGTDNFGRDMLKELLAATGTSLKIGLIAGTIATLLGLMLGLLAGYVGGLVDDILMFIANVFTVIPSFVLLILIYYSVGQAARGTTTCALIIGLTSWVWTARSVRSQVISLRNRDHVNLSKLSGHSLLRIVLTDILPYIASYVVMAFILQVSSGILAEAQLSLLGLGPKTTSVPTLGLMMNWAMLYSAHLNGSWWAYFPVVLIIACISFSLNLMNTGLDQVFNPTLRD